MNNKIMPHHLHQPLRKPISPKQKAQPTSSPLSFQSMLEKAIDKKEELKISKHAEKRMMDREIHISPELWETIHSKILEAKEKGINDSLVLTSDAAFVVSAKNETVITAMDRKEAGAQVFTNINGAILIDE